MTDPGAVALKNWGPWLRPFFAAAVALIGSGIFWSFQVGSYTAKTEAQLDDAKKQVVALQEQTKQQITALNATLVEKLSNTSGGLDKLAAATQAAILQLATQQTQLAVQAQTNIFQDKQLDNLTAALKETLDSLNRLRDRPPAPTR